MRASFFLSSQNIAICSRQYMDNNDIQLGTIDTISLGDHSGGPGKGFRIYVKVMMSNMSKSVKYVKILLFHFPFATKLRMENSVL
jgi:hypothetical protein